MLISPPLHKRRMMPPKRLLCLLITHFSYNTAPSSPCCTPGAAGQLHGPGRTWDVAPGPAVVLALGFREGDLAGAAVPQLDPGLQDLPGPSGGATSCCQCRGMNLEVMSVSGGVSQNIFFKLYYNVQAPVHFSTSCRPSRSTPQPAFRC